MRAGAGREAKSNQVTLHVVRVNPFYSSVYVQHKRKTASGSSHHLDCVCISTQLSQPTLLRVHYRVEDEWEPLALGRVDDIIKRWQSRTDGNDEEQSGHGGDRYGEAKRLRKILY
jgi:hypothetical protein